MSSLNTLEQMILDGMLGRRPDLETCSQELTQTHEALVRCYDGGGTLFTCGNGGSYSDAMHIVGELVKSFERRRPLESAYMAALEPLPFGGELAAHLEAGLPAITLGLNAALKTAVENDCPVRDIAFAQELNVMMKPGDVLLAISTSGNAANCRMALSVAKARGGTPPTPARMPCPPGSSATTMGPPTITTPGASAWPTGTSCRTTC